LLPVTEQIKVFEIIRQSVIAIIAVNGAWCAVLVPTALGNAFGVAFAERALRILERLVISLFLLFFLLFISILYPILSSVARHYTFFSNMMLWRAVSFFVMCFSVSSSMWAIFVSLLAPLDFGIKFIRLKLIIQKRDE